MSLVDRILELFDPKPKRDPELDRVLRAVSATQARRERSHKSLSAVLERYDDCDREMPRRNGHAD